MKLALIALAVAVFTFVALTHGPTLMVKGIFGLAATDAYADADKAWGGWLSIFTYLGMPLFVVGGLAVIGFVVAIAIFVWTRATNNEVSPAVAARDRYGIRGSMDRGD